MKQDNSNYDGSNHEKVDLDQVKNELWNHAHPYVEAYVAALKGKNEDEIQKARQTIQENVILPIFKKHNIPTDGTSYGSVDIMTAPGPDSIYQKGAEIREKNDARLNRDAEIRQTGSHLWNHGIHGTGQRLVGEMLAEEFMSGVDKYAQNLAAATPQATNPNRSSLKQAGVNGPGENTTADVATQLSPDIERYKKGLLAEESAVLKGGASIPEIRKLKEEMQAADSILLSHINSVACGDWIHKGNEGMQIREQATQEARQQEIKKFGKDC
jgi:hypothetical protein